MTVAQRRPAAPDRRGDPVGDALAQPGQERVRRERSCCHPLPRTPGITCSVPASAGSAASAPLSTPAASRLARERLRVDRPVVVLDATAIARSWRDRDELVERLELLADVACDSDRRRRRRPDRKWANRPASPREEAPHEPRYGAVDRGQLVAHGALDRARRRAQLPAGARARPRSSAVLNAGGELLRVVSVLELRRRERASTAFGRSPSHAPSTATCEAVGVARGSACRPCRA